MQPAPWLDDRTPIGEFGCDKREDPGCLNKCLCHPCTVTNYEGCTCMAIISWVTLVCAYFLVGIFVALAWRAPLYGRDYDPGRTYEIKHGPLVVGGGVNAGRRHSDHHVTYDGEGARQRGKTTENYGAAGGP